MTKSTVVAVPARRAGRRGLVAKTAGRTAILLLSGLLLTLVLAPNSTVTPGSSGIADRSAKKGRYDSSVAMLPSSRSQPPATREAVRCPDDINGAERSLGSASDQWETGYLHVTDASTGYELESASIVVTSALANGTLRPDLHVSAKWIRRDARVPIALQGNEYRRPELMTMHVGAPGYEWDSVEFPHAGDSIRVPLRPMATLGLVLSNCPDAIPVDIVITSPTDQVVGLLQPVQPRVARYYFDSLPPVKMVISVRARRTCGQNPLTLGEARVDLESSRYIEQVIQCDDLPSIPPIAPLSGYLVVPRSWSNGLSLSSKVRLRVHMIDRDFDSVWTDKFVLVDIPSAIQVDEECAMFEWDADTVIPGDYAVVVTLPASGERTQVMWTTRVHVPPNGDSQVVVTMPARQELVVNLTGSDETLRQVRGWLVTSSTDIDGIAPQSEVWEPCSMRSLYAMRIDVPLGRVRVGIRCVLNDGVLAMADQVSVCEGRNEVAFVMGSGTGLRIVCGDDESPPTAGLDSRVCRDTITWTGENGWGIRSLKVSGVGPNDAPIAWKYGRGAGLTVHLARPGAYEIIVTHISGSESRYAVNVMPGIFQRLSISSE